MTIRATGPGPPVEFLPRSHRAHDRRLMRISLVAAIALHGGALMLPLPAAPQVSVSEPPRGPVLVIGKAPLPPPPLPERPRSNRPAPSRKIPVPMRETLDLEPVAAPRDPVEMAVADAPAQDWGPLAPVAPPPASGPVPESFPGLVPPALVGARTPPVYPEMGRKLRVEGVVVLRAVIGAEGGVTSIEVLQTPDPDLGFGDAAVRAVSTWRYRPGTHRGRPVPVYLTVYVEFDLH